MKLVILFLLLSLLTLVTVKGEESSKHFYIIKKGDNLSVVLYSIYGRPVWGEQGLFNLTKLENEDFERDGAGFYSNRKIYLSNEVPLNKCNVEFLNSGEVRIKSYVSNRSELNQLLGTGVKECGVEKINRSVASGHFQGKERWKKNRSKMVDYSKVKFNEGVDINDPEMLEDAKEFEDFEVIDTGFYLDANKQRNDSIC